MNLKDKRVLFVVAPKDFRDEELFEPRRILEGYGVKTTVVNSTGDISYGMLGGRVNPGLKFDQVNLKDWDAIIFVGGQGSTVYWENKEILDLAREANLKGKIIGSICLASGILGNAGIFKGKNATGWPDTKEIIEKHQGKYTGKDIEISGRIISAIGPKAVKQFGEAIAKALESEYKD